MDSQLPEIRKIRKNVYKIWFPCSLPQVHDSIILQVKDITKCFNTLRKTKQQLPDHTKSEEVMVF